MCQLSTYSAVSQAVYNFISLRFLFAQRLKISQRWELKTFSGLSWAFTKLWPCGRPYACVWHARFLKIIVELFRGHFISQDFLPRFLVNLLFASTQQLPLIVFDKSCGGKGWVSFESGQMKIALLMGSSREPQDRSSNKNYLQMVLWRSSNPILPSPVAARLLVSTMIWGGWFLRLPQTWERKMQKGHVKMPQNLVFLLRFSSVINLDFFFLE